MQTVWNWNVQIDRREPLQQDIKTDVAVIGAGMAGILTAYLLERAGLDVVILEAERIASGQTHKTTAKITAQHNLIYSKLCLLYTSASNPITNCWWCT